MQTNDTSKLTKIPTSEVYYCNVSDKNPVIAITIHPCEVTCAVCYKFIHRIETATCPHETELAADCTIINGDYYYFVHNRCRSVGELCPEALH